MPHSRFQFRPSTSAALHGAVLAALLGLPAMLPAQTVAPGAAPKFAPLSQWKPYRYPADGFKAEFPVEPGMRKKNIPTDAGPIELRTYTALDGEVALQVSVCDYGSHLPPKDPATLLEGAKNGALHNSESHLVSERKISIDGHPGIQLESASEDSHFSARLILVGTSLYQVIAAYPSAAPYPETNHFLDSFELIPRTTSKQ